MVLTHVDLIEKLLHHNRTSCLLFPVLYWNLSLFRSYGANKRQDERVNVRLISGITQYLRTCIRMRMLNNIL